MTDPLTLDVLFFATGGDGTGYRPLHHRGDLGDGIVYVDNLDRAMWEKLIRGFSKHGEIAVGLVPTLDKRMGATTRGTCCWVRIESRQQLDRARRIQPRPTLATREKGTVRHTLLWAFNEPAGPDRIEAANRRLAYACGAVQKHGKVRQSIHPPGTFIPLQRKKLDVSDAGGSRELYPDVDAIAGRLKDPPPPRFPA